MTRSIHPLQVASWIIVLWGISQAKTFLIPLLLAGLLSFMMAPIVIRLRKSRLPEWAAITVTSILLVLPVFALAVLVINEGTVLLRDYPTLLVSLKDNWARLESSTFVEQLNLSDYLDISYLQQKLGEEAGKGISFALESLRALIEAGIYLFIVLFFSVIMLASRTQLKKSATKFFTHSRTLDDIVLLIEKFLIARIGIALLVACLDCVILKSFGSRYSVLLGCVFGMSTLIPVVGFILATLPTIALSLAVGHSLFQTGVLVSLLYLVSSLESHWITPKYLGRQLNLNLLATFIGLLAGEMLWGIWGMVLSIPILGIARIILEATDEMQPWASLLADKDLSSTQRSQR